MLNKKRFLTEKEVRAKRKLLNAEDHVSAMIFKALGDITRFRMFRLLIDQLPIPVSTIAKILDRSIPLTSQHVQILTQAKLLKKTRVGNIVLCEVNHDNPCVKEIVKTIRRTMKYTC